MKKQKLGRDESIVSSGDLCKVDFEKKHVLRSILN